MVEKKIKSEITLQGENAMMLLLHFDDVEKIYKELKAAREKDENKNKYAISLFRDNGVWKIINI